MLDQFAADRTSYSLIMVQLREALSAKSMSAVNQDSGYFLPDIEPVSAIITIVEPACLVIGLNNPLSPFFPLVLLVLLSF